MVYRDGKRLGNIAIDDISDVIKQPATFVWLGLHEPDKAQLREIQHAWKAGYAMAVALTVLGCLLVYRRLRRAGWV